MMIAMLTGGIDLSVVGLANLAAIAAGLFFARVGTPGYVLIGADDPDGIDGFFPFGLIITVWALVSLWP